MNKETKMERNKKTNKCKGEDVVNFTLQLTSDSDMHICSQYGFDFESDSEGNPNLMVMTMGMDIMLHPELILTVPISTGSKHYKCFDVDAP